jgi:hypothetical protein
VKKPETFVFGHMPAGLDIEAKRVMLVQQLSHLINAELPEEQAVAKLEQYVSQQLRGIIGYVAESASNSPTHLSSAARAAQTESLLSA